jgi:NAD-dependent SIR2 family protein deacetylase
MPFSGDQLNLLNETNQNPLTESTQFEPLILQQLLSNFLLQDNLIPSSLIQLDDGTLLNVKTVNSEEGEELAHVVQNVSLLIEKPRNLECDICHKKYASKDVLRKHRKIHGIDWCGKCEKWFDSGEELETHKKTHEE